MCVICCGFGVGSSGAAPKLPNRIGRPVGVASQSVSPSVFVAHASAAGDNHGLAGDGASGWDQAAHMGPREQNTPPPPRACT